MKLGTVRDGSRDGQLAVVSRDNKRYKIVGSQIPTLQYALDRWDALKPQLETLYQSVNNGDGNPIKDGIFGAPLPRAYEWVDGSAYINHIVLVRKARNAAPPETLRTDPMVYQGGSGILLGPNDDIPLKDEAWGCDFESEVCVILGDTKQGTTKDNAAPNVKLLMLANDVSLRNLIPEELAKGFGFFVSKPATAFSPFAVTPDELGSAWKEGRVHLPLITKLNGKLFGEPNAGPEMHFSFYDLMQHICRTRAYTAGTILGSGTVSNEDRAKGSSCLAEKRMIETIDTGKAATPFLHVGDKVEIEMFNERGESIFGKISQKIVPFKS